MENRRLITVAIHTFDKATALKALLEHEGVAVTLQNVNLSAPVVSAGVRVRIFEEDLPLALRIIENPEIFSVATGADSGSTAPESQTILLPVDFSPRSFQAARLAFSIAAANHSRVVFLHAYLVPRSNALISLSSSLTFDSSGLSQAEEAETSVEIAKGAHERMDALIGRVRSAIKSGEMDAAKFSSVLVEGVPEECIAQYVKDHPSTRLIVMGTRAAEQKAHDLSGSISAEVLNSSRVQTLIIPENDADFISLDGVNKVALLSSLEQEDFLAMDALYRLMPADKSLDVKVVCLPDNKYTRATADAARTALSEYCSTHFPRYRFSIVTPGNEIDSIGRSDVDLIIIPNRRKNIFARLFNPGLANRILFHSDVPMMVIPV